MISRVLRAVICIAFAVTAQSAFAANWYVLKGATGSNNGSSWSNAWNELSQINYSSVACGDTIWLGGGTYTSGFNIGKTCSSASSLTIQTVLSSDSVPTSAAGYTSAVLGQVLIPNQTVTLTSGSYVVLSGRHGSPATNDFGIVITCTGSGGCNAMGGATSGNISNMTVAYVEMYGPTCVTSSSCGGAGASGFNVAPSSNTVNGIVLDHVYIHRWGELIRTSNWSNCVIQNSWLADIHNDGPQHEDIIYNYANINLTMRYNTIWGNTNDGIFFDFGGTTGFQFYGNVYFHSGGALISFKQGYSFGTAYIYNNVFENDGKFGDYQPGWISFGGTMSGGAVMNNVFENTQINGTAPNADYNAYSTSVGKSDSGAHSFTYNGGTLGSSPLFINENSTNPDNGVFNFRLTSQGASTLQNGTTLASPYNVDPDGVLRGSDGKWYIGAFQYAGTSQTQAPQPPTGLVVSVQ